MNLPEKTLSILDQMYKKNSYMELTIGILDNGHREIVHWNPERTETAELLCYPVGSICKTFTASLLSKYVEEGKLDLSAPLSDYITGLPERYYPSLRRLAVHSSGYGGKPFSTAETLWRLANMNKPDGLMHVNPFRGTIDEEKMRQIIIDTKLQDKEYKFEYSNLAYGILGYIIGTVSGKGFWDTMNEYVQDELGLKGTFLGNVPMVGYDKKENTCECWKWEKSDIIAPAGALNSDAADMLEYAKMQMDGKRRYMDVCHQVHGVGGKDFMSGLAWRLEKDGISWHTGSAGAFSCWLGIKRKENKAVFVGLNYALADVEGIGFSILRSL